MPPVTRAIFGPETTRPSLRHRMSSSARAAGAKARVPISARKAARTRATSVDGLVVARLEGLPVGVLPVGECPLERVLEDALLLLLQSLALILEPGILFL